MRRNASIPIQVTCDYTGEQFFVSPKQFNAHKRRKLRYWFKNKEIALKASKEGWNARFRRKPVIEKQCPCCNKVFKVRDLHNQKKYCSRVCAATDSFKILSEDPERLAVRTEKLKQVGKRRPRNQTKPLHRKCCVICNQPFFVPTSRKRTKTCSKACYSKLCSVRISANPNCGGQTNYYHYEYKGVHMDSQWEVDIAKWMDEHKIQWKRDRSMMFHWTDTSGKRHRYYPDFYLPDHDLYLDPKNKYLMVKDEFKINAVIQEHKINIVWGLKETVLSHLKQLTHIEGAIEPGRLQNVSNKPGE